MFFAKLDKSILFLQFLIYNQLKLNVHKSRVAKLAILTEVDIAMQALLQSECLGQLCGRALHLLHVGAHIEIECGARVGMT